MRWVVVTMALLLASCGPMTQMTNTTVTDMNSTEGMDTMSDNMTAIDDGSASANDTMSANEADMSANVPEPPRAQARPERPIYCEAFSAFMLSEQCDRLATQKARLARGVAAFRRPTSMTVGVAEDMVLALGTAADAPELDQAIGTGAGTGPAMKIGVKLARYMTATLSGGGFTIEPSGDVRHDLGGGAASVWQWRVTPKTAGKQALLLKIQANAVDEHGDPTEIGLVSRTFEIGVRVTRLDWINRGLTILSQEVGLGTVILSSVQKLFLALAATIAAAAAVYIGIRRFSNPPDGGRS